MVYLKIAIIWRTNSITEKLQNYREKNVFFCLHQSNISVKVRDLS